MGYGKDFLDGNFGLVERHHIFGGALRRKSERYGLVVELSPWNHREGPRAAHRCKATADKLKRYGQRKVMLEQGWDVDTFIREFGKNYLSEDDLAYFTSLQESGDYLEPSDYDDGEDWIREETEPVAIRFHPGDVFRVTLEIMPF